MLTKENSVLVVIDFQGNLAQAMDNKQDLFSNVQKLIRGVQALEIPVLATEQIPAKLGSTIPEIAQHLTGAKIIAKEGFSCWKNESFKKELTALNRKQILISGIEAHICVYQTAMDLVEAGYEVQVVADAISSRTPQNRITGIQKMAAGGVGITSTEMALFELLKTAADPKARQIFQIVK
ncbi:MAG: hydrolase [Syntrophales bacterium]